VDVGAIADEPNKATSRTICSGCSLHSSPPKIMRCLLAFGDAQFVAPDAGERLRPSRSSPEFEQWQFAGVNEFDP